MVVLPSCIIKSAKTQKLTISDTNLDIIKNPKNSPSSEAEILNDLIETS